MFECVENDDSKIMSNENVVNAIKEFNRCYDVFILTRNSLLFFVGLTIIYNLNPIFTLNFNWLLGVIDLFLLLHLNYTNNNKNITSDCLYLTISIERIKYQMELNKKKV